MEQHWRIEGNATEIIRQRRSCRNYSDAPVEKDKLKQLTAIMAELKSCPFGSETRFELLETNFEGKGRVPGTYGVIKGTKYFLTGAVKRNENEFYDFGYLFEGIILTATAMELGTCWMGGTFKRSMFADRIGLKSGEILPAVSPVGYPSKRSSVVDTVFRFGAGSNNRLPWQVLFFRDDFNTPMSEEEAGEYAIALEMVRLGPSASNRQPWRMVKNNNGIHLFLQRNNKYDKLVKDIDLQKIDMGIAMCHFELSIRERGITGKWEKTGCDISPMPERMEYIASWID